jgi:amino acid transporter
LIALSAIYSKQVGDSTVANFFRNILQPFPSVLAIAVTKNIWVAVIISLGFMANAFQAMCSCFIGVTRILVAMSADRMLPSTLALDRIDPQRRAPIRAHWLYFVASVPFILGYNFVSGWRDYETLLVTFACGYVFVMSCLAATRIPHGRLRSLWMASDIFRIPGWTLKVCGFLGAALGLAMVIAYLVVPDLGLGRPAAIEGFLTVVVFSIAIYAYGTHKFHKDVKAFTAVPYEAEEFYK